MRRRPSDRQLRRWLRTGRPRRIAELIETDDVVLARLEALTRLDQADVAALDELAKPRDDFEVRTVTAVQARRNDDGTASMVADLLGLGFHVGRALMNRPAADGDEESP